MGTFSNPKLTSGRCWKCGSVRRPVVYRWKAKKGRRLHQARCPRDPEGHGFLSQTTVGNMKRPVIRIEDPVFEAETE